jgi:hypothetical protein
VRGFLNAGYRRGNKVPRCVGEGSRMSVREFDVFAPVAIAGIGKLPPTTETRAIVVHMKPRTKGEPVERFRLRKVRPDAEALCARWEAWATANTGRLADAEPDLPDELSDRMQDVWEPLLAIADLAGGEWPARARAAAVELYRNRGEDEESLGRRLLADIRSVFDDPELELVYDEEKGAAIASRGLATALAEIEGAPWAEFGKDDQPISANKVSRMLKKFGIRPDQHWVAGRNLRGYLRSDFEDAWSRHLPEQSDRGAEVLGPKPSKGNGPNTSDPLTLSPGAGDAGDDGARVSRGDLDEVAEMFPSGDDPRRFMGPDGGR